MVDPTGLPGRVERVERDLADLEYAVVHISEVLVELVDRMIRGIERVDGRFDAAGERLERLLAVTLEERTASTERLGDVERRVARLEERLAPEEPPDAEP